MNHLLISQLNKVAEVRNRPYYYLSCKLPENLTFLRIHTTSNVQRSRYHTPVREILNSATPNPLSPKNNLNLNYSYLFKTINPQLLKREKENHKHRK